MLTLKKFKQQVQRVYTNRRINQVLLLHDNASLHTTEAFLTMELTVLPHPACCPDLVPSDFHIFGPLKDGSPRMLFGR